MDLEKENVYNKAKKKKVAVSFICIYCYRNVVTGSESNFSKTSLGYISEAFIVDFAQNCVFDSFKL